MLFFKLKRQVDCGFLTCQLTLPCTLLSPRLLCCNLSHLAQKRLHPPAVSGIQVGGSITMFKPCLLLPVTICFNQASFTLKALTDSGTEQKLFDMELVKKLALPLTPLESPNSAIAMNSHMFAMITRQSKPVHLILSSNQFGQYDHKIGRDDYHLVRMREGNEWKTALWEDCRLSFFEDMTKERVSQCKMFHPMMKVLWQHQVKHTLAHLATL